MNVVDSSAWLEYFCEGPNASNYLAPLENPEKLIVPVVTIYEVFKFLLHQRDEDAALLAIGQMQKGIVVPVDSKLAIQASVLSLQYKIPMADSLILATAQAYSATIWTQDAHFQTIPDVKYFTSKE